MKDKKGNKVKAGDLMAEIRGHRSDGKNHTILIQLWEVPAIMDGHGIQYSSEGEEISFSWAYASASHKLDPEKLPEGFVFAFKHGLDDFHIDEKFMSLDIHEAIKNSDWQDKALTPEIVEKLRIASEVVISSFSDIAEKWDLIFTPKVSHRNIIDQILLLFDCASGVRPVSVAGLWFADMYEFLEYTSIRWELEEWRESGCLLSKCKELDGERAARAALGKIRGNYVYM